MPDARDRLAEIKERVDVADGYLRSLRGDDGLAAARVIGAVRRMHAALEAVLGAARHVLDTAAEQGEHDFDGWSPEALAKDIEDRITAALAGQR